MANYASMGYDLSLRQLYYQHVAHHALPNTEASYDMLGKVISDARLAGRLPWEMLVDRGRGVLRNSHWTSPADMVEQDARAFNLDMWRGQPRHVVVMVEKQALEGVLVPVCESLDVPFYSNKGYSSSSALFNTGKGIANKLQTGKDIVIIYLGDHDPSGIDMTRDVEGRIALFAGAGYWDDYRQEVVLSDDYHDRFYVNRIALNMPQVEAYSPPPNPAKLTDSRAKKYIREYGPESWELDALAPDVLANLVRTEIERHIYLPAWEARESEQAAMRETLREVAVQVRAEQPGTGAQETEVLTGGVTLPPI